MLSDDRYVVILNEVKDPMETMGFFGFASE